jgi:ABC-2 type transport system ATP-binding protein
MIMHSHGWGGSRATQPDSFQELLDHGYGVLSFDQRGFGASGGQAHVENPAYEGKDVRKLVQLVSGLPWVRQDGPGDPRLAAIGGSYGGGYQFLGAFEELRLRGKPVFDALAPEITWYDLHQSLGVGQGIYVSDISSLFHKICQETARFR